MGPSIAVSRFPWYIAVTVAEKGTPDTTLEGAVITRTAWPGVPQLTEANPSKTANDRGNIRATGVREFWIGFIFSEIRTPNSSLGLRTAMRAAKIRFCPHARRKRGRGRHNPEDHPVPLAQQHLILWRSGVRKLACSSIDDWQIGTFDFY